MARIDCPARHWCQNSASCDSESPGRPVLAICTTSPNHINSDVLHRPIEPAVYSVEKLGIHRDAIFQLRERTTFNSYLTCIQADARARTEATATNRCPLVSRNLGGF